VVVVGSIWDYGNSNSDSKLIHLDWQGNILHEEALPAGPREGGYAAYDMRPQRPGDWNRLLIYQGFHPKQGGRRHQFLTYDLAARKLTLVRGIPVEESRSNAGKWLYISADRSVFISNPSMGQFYAWEGDILGGGEVTPQPLPRTNPLEIGYLGSEYTMVPDPLQGSVETPGVAYLMSDLINPNKSPERPCSLVLWRLSLD